MNQRRSDHTHADWKGLAVDLALTDDNGTVEIREFEIGYRSTRQIIKFANQLLPRGTRGEQALRDGPPPTVLKTDNDSHRRTECFARVLGLSDTYEGYVAWITHAVTPADRLFREGNWMPGRLPHTWQRNDRTIVILHPDHARGIEFDAVVVEEPAAFEQNLGRDGVLYTSLTRANKELVVVHTKALPKPLRSRG
jgi:DNA helicase IV